jgi:hypothetical protein
MSAYQARREQERQQACESFAVMCDRLAELSAKIVTIEYDGYGDSGTVETVIAESDGTEVELSIDDQNELIAAAESLLPGGWEINEGSYGRLMLDVEERRLTREHNWRVESTEYEEEGWDL